MKLRTEAEIIAHNERALAACRADAPPRRRQDPGPSPADQHWTVRRSWSGEEYFVPGTERNEYVIHQYNPLEASDD
jgi:hypothetical protein